MPKNSVAEWSTTAGLNTDIAGINIDEGMFPDGVNNALRAMMAQIAALWTLPSTTYIYTDPGGAVGPAINLLRDSASPGPADVIAQITFQGKDSTNAVTNYARLTATIDDPLNGSEDGTLYAVAMVNGAETVVASFSTNMTVSRPLLATTGTFSGAVSASSYGAVSATTGAFSGAVSMAGLTATTGVFSGLITTASTTGTIAAVLGAQGIQVMATGGAGNATFITFHRPGAFAVAFGVDTDNKLKWGGWSLGAAAYEIYHSGSASIASAGAISSVGNATVGGVLTVNGAGVSNFAGSVISGNNLTGNARVFTGQAFQSLIATVIVGPQPTVANEFSIYFRPRGADSGTLQATLHALTGEFRPISVAEYSDERMKEGWNVVTKSIVDDAAKLEIGSFTWKESGGVKGFGVGAMALRDIMPEVVTEDPDGMLGVSYGKAAMGIVIDACRRIVALEKRLEELKAA